MADVTSVPGRVDLAAAAASTSTRALTLGPACNLVKLLGDSPFINNGQTLVKMESLSPECTPLKQRYDTCFNAWFEGYLQPNLAAEGSNSLNQPIYSSLSSSSPGSSSSGTQPPNAPSAGVTGIAEQGGQPTPVTVEEVRPGKPLITSWSNALRRRAYPTSGDAATGIIEGGGIVETEAVAEQKGETGVRSSRRPIDTRGKNRAQIKAEEYERDCGDAFRAYQGCLVKAIAENPSLSTLLEQARSEHPLPSLNGLEGTPWESK